METLKKRYYLKGYLVKNFNEILDITFLIIQNKYKIGKKI